MMVNNLFRVKEGNFNLTSPAGNWKLKWGEEYNRHSVESCWFPARWISLQ